MEGICVNFLDEVQFFWFLKGRCHTSCEKMVKFGSVVFELKWGRKWKMSCKSAEIGLYCRISQQLLNRVYQCFGSHFCTSCKNLVSKCFHTYLLGGDTTAPRGLYARLCHAFSSFIVNCNNLAKKLAFSIYNCNHIRLPGCDRLV